MQIELKCWAALSPLVSSSPRINQERQLGQPLIRLFSVEPLATPIITYMYKRIRYIMDPKAMGISL